MIRDLVFVLLVGLLGQHVPAHGERITVESRISNVIVYRDRALVFREAGATIPAGTHEILFPRLPGSLIAQSIRVSSASEPVKILGVSLRAEDLQDQRTVREKNLAQQIEALQEQLQQVCDDQQTHKDLIRFYQVIGEKAGSLLAEHLTSNPDTEPLDWQRFYRRLADVLRKERESVRTLEPRRRDLERRVAALQQELSATQEVILQGYEAVVAVEAVKPTRSMITLSYVARGAGWIPVYDVRYLQEDSVLEISYRAIVRQRTCEPWEDVRLTLSTGRPLLYGRPKQLRPWLVGLGTSAAPPRPSGSGEAQPGAAAPRPPSLPEDNDGLESTGGSLFTPTDLGSSELRAQTDGVGFTFRVPVRQDVPSGAGEARVNLGAFRFSARIQRIAIPRQGPYTFLRAVMVNDSTHTFLPGEANIFFGNDFLSFSSIQTTAPGSTLDFYLGLDPQIEVRQTRLEQSRDSSGLILHTGQEINWKWKLDIYNHRDSPVVLEVVDLVPVPQHAGLKLEDFRCRDHPYTLQEDGTVRWVLELDAGEHRMITYSYKLKFPRGAVLSGVD